MRSIPILEHKNVMNWRKIPLYSVEKVVHFSYDGTILKSYNMSYPDVLLLHISCRLSLVLR